MKNNTIGFIETGVMGSSMASHILEDGIINNARPGTYVIDMTTSKPNLAKIIYEKAKEKGIYSLDAPVSGGDIG
ncbi:2-hydroxy-3-oxopropionate reductase [Clostridium homopropionicum DSM 5847]|uniref:2-hydroxy-3-oxopropionate reductase n=1 Tax=Clostridium homopropionicum DSM 5847 TaxID=1121318 RepID=A0A0L6Z6W9_9CLOT|nr:2-hydroxy-3-oxopropionate reductase [Clostridium homopropionicum DSM 5847]SFG53125.1 NAD binding domain of 6-phosphogluconate dehydrogenase [Clostridium homopropionicum]